MISPGGLISTLLTGVASAVQSLIAANTRFKLGTGASGTSNNFFIDSSSNNFDITRNGNVCIGSNSPFSPNGWAGYFPITSSLQVPAAASISGTADFTLEFWINPTPFTAAYQVIFANDTSGGFSSSINTNGTITFGRSLIGTDSTTSTSVAFNKWNHVAFVKIGSTITIYINGTAGAVASNSYSWAAGIIRIGTDGGGSALPFNGYLSNFRIVKGTGVYTGAFAPQTYPLVAIAGTSVLTLQSNRFKDVSTNAYAITVNGAVSIQNVSPFPSTPYALATHSTSLYFDGNGDYCSTNMSINWSTYGVYTLEFYVYLNSLAGVNQTFFSNGGTGYTNFYIYGTGSASPGAIALGINGVNEIKSANGVITANQWHHVAFQYDGTNTKIYVNGILVASAVTAVYANNSSTVTLGNGLGGSFYLNGYMSGIRLTKSIIYPTAFTPPIAPPINIANTWLLILTQAGIYDEMGHINFETSGSAAVSSNQSYSGGTSVSFNGTTGYIRGIPSQSLIIGTANFNIDLYCYFNSVSGTSSIFDTRSDNVDTANALICYQDTGKIVVYFNTGVRIQSTAISAGAWHHIVISRVSGTLTLTVDGASAGSIADSTSFVMPQLMIGAGAFRSTAPTTYHNGYIDDMTLTIG